MIKAGMLADEFRKVPGSQITYTLVDWCEGFSLGQVTGRVWVERQSLTFKKRKKRLFCSYVEWSEVTQLCPTLCDPMDWSLPGSSVHRILQARILEWIDIPFSRGSPRPKDWTWVSYIAGRFFTVWATREAQIFSSFWFFSFKQVSVGIQYHINIVKYYKIILHKT